MVFIDVKDKKEKKLPLIEKSRKEEKPKMSLDDKAVMNKFLEGVREFSSRVGSVEKIVPLNRRVIIGRFFKDSEGSII